MKHLLTVSFLSVLLGALVAEGLAQKPGEIVFAKTAINPSGPAGLTAEFQAGDNIYAMAFLDKSVVEMKGSRKSKKDLVEVFIYELKPPLYDYQQPSEAQLVTSTLWISGDAVHGKSLPLDIVPDPNSMTAYGTPDFFYKKFGDRFDGPVKFAEAMSKLEEGEHTIIVKVKYNYNVVGEGKFTIKGGDFSKYAAKADELNTSASSLKTKDAVMPKAARTDKSLEADMERAFKASQTYKDRVKGEVLRVVIIDPDWMIRRNAITGIILHRYIRAAIAVKNDDGTCTVWQLVTFQQDYVSNKFQATRFDGIGDPFTIPCEKIQK
jgi:hypothetical protein